MTLSQLADRLLERSNEKHGLDIVHAINLDGGSSSTLVEHVRNRHREEEDVFRVVNNPTCLDIVPYKCERPVATVLCFSDESIMKTVPKAKIYD